VPRLYVYPAILSRFLSARSNDGTSPSAYRRDTRSPRRARFPVRRPAVVQCRAAPRCASSGRARCRRERGALRFQLHVPFARDRFVSLLLIRADFHSSFLFLSLSFSLLFRSFPPSSRDVVSIYIALSIIPPLYLGFGFVFSSNIYCAFALAELISYRTMIIAIVGDLIPGHKNKFSLSFFLSFVTLFRLF